MELVTLLFDVLKYLLVQTVALFSANLLALFLAGATLLFIVVLVRRATKGL